MKLHSETYDSYKNAEGEWSDTIPSEWQEKRVKDLFRLVTDAAPADNDYELLSLYAGIGVKPRKDLEARGNKASSTDGYWIVRKNDIVVNKLLAWMGSVGLSEYDGVTSPAYDVLRQVSKDIDPRYFAYLFRTETAKKIFRKNSRGIMDMRLRLYFDKLGAITVPVPSYREQTIISSFISNRCDKIDKKIMLLNEVVEKTKELKIKIIKSLVTFGINHNEPTHKSDFFLGEKSPVSWKPLKISQEFKVIGSGTTPKAGVDEYYSSGTINWINSGDLNDGILTSSKKKITKKAFAIHSLRMYPENSLIIAMYGASIGKVSISKIEGCTNQACCVLSGERDLSLSFLFYWLLANRNLLISLSYGGGQPNISQDTIKNLRVMAPDPVEQKSIVDEIELLLKKQDAKINLIDKQIKKLKELKIALINDVITGAMKLPSGTENKGEAV